MSIHRRGELQSPKLHIYIYIYIYMCVCVCVCVYREREREKKKKKKNCRGTGSQLPHYLLTLNSSSKSLAWLLSDNREKRLYRWSTITRAPFSYVNRGP